MFVKLLYLKNCGIAQNQAHFCLLNLIITFKLSKMKLTIQIKIRMKYETIFGLVRSSFVKQYYRNCLPIMVKYVVQNIEN
jgi:hypothetical protein